MSYSKQLLVLENVNTCHYCLINSMFIAPKDDCLLYLKMQMESLAFTFPKLILWDKNVLNVLFYSIQGHSVMEIIDNQSLSKILAQYPH